MPPSHIILFLSFFDLPLIFNKPYLRFCFINDKYVKIVINFIWFRNLLILMKCPYFQKNSTRRGLPTAAPKPAWLPLTNDSIELLRHIVELFGAQRRRSAPSVGTGGRSYATGRVPSYSSAGADLIGGKGIFEARRSVGVGFTPP